MPSRINTVVLGAVEPHLVDIFAIEGRGTPRYALRMERGARTSASAQSETVLLPAVPAGMPLLDEDLQPVFRWAERICRDPGLSEVESSAVPAALRIFVECGLAGICARRGSALTVIVGAERGDVGPEESRAARAHLATLAAGGVDLLYLGRAPTMPATGRAVAYRTLSPDILGPLDAAGLNVLDAVFAPAEEIAEATGLSRRQAVAVQLGTAEEAMRYRAAVWPGGGSALDARLAAQAAALSRPTSSGVARRPPPAAPARTEGAPSMVMMASAGPSHPGPFEMRPPRLGEAVALVPFFDAASGTVGLIPMQPRLADALQSAGQTKPQPGSLAAPSRRASPRPRLEGLLAKIDAWRADRR